MREQEVGVGGLLEHDTEHVLRATDACGPGRRLVRIGLEPSDEFFQIVRRQALSADDHLRIAGQQTDRFEVVRHNRIAAGGLRRSQHACSRFPFISV